MKRNYEMSEEQYAKIMQACEPVPLIMLQLGMPRSPQERANDAWEALGKEMGFQHMTVGPDNSGNERCFIAEPNDD